MSIEIKVPVLPESVADATIATWHKQPGEPVMQDENLVDIETDKVVLEVVAPEDGTIEKLIKNAGDTVLAEEVIATFKAGKVEAAADKSSQASEAKSTKEPAKDPAKSAASSAASTTAGPAARRMLQEKNLSPDSVAGTGVGGRVTTSDVKQHQAKGVSAVPEFTGERPEKRVPMTRLRAKIAQRLLSAQQNAAILTTFNEVNMQPVMDLRAKFKDKFEKQHGVKLGFMSFFAKAALEALKRFPEVNASIDGNDIVYHGYYDLGIAVSTDRGLVVPIVRNADNLSMAQIESTINDLGQKARQGTLSLDDMTGGTFTISNGGVFGSLLSTPILNPPQTGILGMHKIEKRAVVENDQVVIRPMMYLALSYDHRLIDGAQSVKFLLTIKEMLEDPARLILEV